MTIAFYISGHGFGHASRDIELIAAMARLRSDLRFLVRTSAPDWLFTTVRATIDLQPAVVDTGLAQLDSLRFDEQESAEQARRFYRSFDERTEQEAAILRRSSVSLVIGDIPPLAFAAAARAGIPSVALGNFTWDWIYGAYRSFDDVTPTIRDAYRLATRALRLPLGGGFESMRDVTTDIPLIARLARRARQETRALLNASDARPLVLVSFGGYGADLPIDRLMSSSSFDVVTFHRHPPHGLTHQDVVAAADVVVSKPGYGIVSECIGNGTALLYTSRGHFVEYDVLVAEMPRMLRCRFISQEELFAGRWDAAVTALLAQPQPPERPRVDGAEVAAREIVLRD